MGIGTNIKRLLATKKVTIKELSERTGIPVNSLYSITRRDSESTKSEYLRKIASALNVGIDEIVSIPAVEVIHTLSALDRPDEKIFDAVGKPFTPGDAADLFAVLNREDREKVMTLMLDLAELERLREENG